MKYLDPTKGKGFRDLFRKYGYKVYLVDEFKTSCKCSKCLGGDCEKFREKVNMKTGSKFLIHGLLKCKTCRALIYKISKYLINANFVRVAYSDMKNFVFHYGENSSNNIYNISKNAILGIPRPLYLQRPKTKT